MAESLSTSRIGYRNATAAAVAVAIVFVFWHVMVNLAAQWWDDENYSHGLLVPFVIAYIVWLDRERLLRSMSPSVYGGMAMAAISGVMLIGGLLAAELFTQRVSLVVMLAATVVYFGGRRLLGLLAVPFALLLLSIPIPQIAFNRIAFPLQIWASQMAVWLVRLVEIPVTRKGNVIDILPRGATQTISLEVVEACSGIRSLMTLMVLGLIIGHITRRSSNGIFGLSRNDAIRAILLVVAAVPIAVITNAARVGLTGILTFYYGKQATDGMWHDSSGWLVYVVALALLWVTNMVLSRILPSRPAKSEFDSVSDLIGRRVSSIPLVAAMVVIGIFATWLSVRTENIPEREQLTNLANSAGIWKQRGSEIKFDVEVEGVLKATDYTMREYTAPDGRIANIYIGYYETQRTGGTYHSPQNCLPGAGWVLSEPERVIVTTPNGKSFDANKYVIENGIYREVMIYWYQGRGRIEASEYRDKLNTVIDGITRNRTDGSMIRVMTATGNDDATATKAALDLAGEIADRLDPFLPE